MPYRFVRPAPRLRTVRDGPRATQAVLLAFATVLAAAGCSPYPSPPDTARAPVVDTLHGVAITDDYRWLEEQDSPETRAWIAEQNAYAEQIVGDTPLRRGLEARLRELMNVPGALFPRRAGDYEYFSFRAPDREVGAIYRRPAPEEPQREPIDPDSDLEMVLDPLDIHPDGTTSVSIRDFSPDGTLMMYAIRDGGQDEVMIRIRDVTTGEDLPDRLPNFLYGSTFFDPEGTGFYYTWRSREVGPRVRHHTLGTDIADDTELFGVGHGPETFITATQGGDGRYMVYTVQHGWARSDVYLHDLAAGTEPRPISVGAPARFRARFMDDEIHLLTNLDAPRNRVLAVDLRDPDPDPANWREVIAEASDLLTGYQIIEGAIYADYLYNVSSRIVRYDLDGTQTGEIPLPEHHVATLRSWGEGAGLLTLTSLVTTTHIVRIDLETHETEPWLPSAVPFDGAEYEVSQVWYTSADGTEAPMYVAHRRGYEPDGDTPTLLYGYGGFNSNNMPRFNNGAAAWMEQGGVYALATLRGGGEFGEEWHRAGMLENKPNVFDDFIAAAEWLIANGYTSPDRLAIRGVSNGGLLVGSALTKRPDLYRAVFCGLPDLDMVRFYQFTDSNNMPALLEYGNAAVAEEFEVLRTFSPYQNVRDGVAYPAVMLTQGDLDTRVPPLQARKMAARLQAASSSGLPVILDYDPRAGHAGGRTFNRSVRNTAMELAFLLGQLGVGGGGGPMRRRVSRAACSAAFARGLFGSLLAVLALAPTRPLAAQCDDCTFPGDTWEMVRGAGLAEHGWDPDALQRAAAFLRDSANSTGVVVAHKGRVVFSFGDIEELSYLASVRKSILAMLYGHWVKNGVIDLNATLADLGVDDIGGLLPIERQATVDHLVTARSGVYHPASNSGDNLAEAPPRGSQQPGAYMLYSNWDFNAAGAVFEQLTGRDIYDEAQAQLAIPLGFEDWDRSAQRKSGNLTVSRNPAYHFWLSTRDMARIGHLMLNEGAWNGEQVISREWARRIVNVVTPLEEMNPTRRRNGYFGYGYMWWVFDGPRVSGPFEGAYTGRGAVGQWISVFPALDLVIAHKTKSAYGRTTSWSSWQRLVELLFDAHGVEMPGPYPWAAEGG